VLVTGKEKGQGWEGKGVRAIEKRIDVVKLGKKKQSKRTALHCFRGDQGFEGKGKGKKGLGTGFIRRRRSWVPSLRGVQSMPEPKGNF